MAWPKHWTIGNLKWYFQEGRDATLDREVENTAEIPMDTMDSDSGNISTGSAEQPMDFNEYTGPNPWYELEPMDKSKSEKQSFSTNLEPFMNENKMGQQIRELHEFVDDAHDLRTAEFKQALKGTWSIMEDRSSKQAGKAKEPCSLASESSDTKHTSTSGSGAETEISNGRKELQSQLNNSTAPLVPIRRSTRTCVLAKEAGFYKQLHRGWTGLKAAKLITSQVSTGTTSSGQTNTAAVVQNEENSSHAETTNEDMELDEIKDDYFDLNVPYCRHSLKLKINLRILFLEMVISDLEIINSASAQKSTLCREDLIQLGKKTAAYLFMDYDRIPNNWVNNLKTYYSLTRKDFGSIRWIHS